MTILGELIKEKRGDESLRDFAKRCGVSHQYIRNLEKCDPRSGKTVTPSIDILSNIAMAIKMSLKELMETIGYFEANTGFEPSNLKIVRGNRTYKQICGEIAAKTGSKIDPSIYEAVEEGGNTDSIGVFVDILAKFAGVDQSFFCRKNADDVLEYAKKQIPYRDPSQKGQSMYHTMNEELHRFVCDPANHEYLLLAKDLSECNVDTEPVRETFLANKKAQL